MDNDQTRIQSVLSEKYEIKELIQAGGMGKIFLGIHKVLEKKVAIKIIHQELISNEQIKSRFYREAKLAASLDHSGIIDIYDFGSSDDFDYIIMPFIEGETLLEKIKRKGAMNAQEALPIMIETTEALNYAHEHNVIHRDIKPSNIMFDNQGKVIIADFGISKDMDDSDLTAPNSVLGSPRYMSPEQIKGSTIDTRSDLYSLGLVFYEMVVGSHPYKGKDNAAIYYSQVHETPPSPQMVDPEIPRQLGCIIMKFLEKSPENRYATGAEAVQDFRDFQAGKEIFPMENEDATVLDEATVLEDPTVFNVAGSVDEDATVLEEETIVEESDDAATIVDSGALAGVSTDEEPSGTTSWFQENKKMVMMGSGALIIILILGFIMFSGPSDNTPADNTEVAHDISAEEPAAVSAEPETTPIETPVVATPDSTEEAVVETIQPESAVPEETPANESVVSGEPIVTETVHPEPVEEIKVAAISDEIPEPEPEIVPDSIVPEKVELPKTLIDAILSIGETTAGSDFSLWTNQQTFHIDDRIQYSFQSNVSCYAVVLAYSTQGELIQMFPSFFNKSQFVVANKEYSIPNEKMGFELKVTGPPGKDTIIALVSDSPFELFEPMYSENNPFLSFSANDTSLSSGIMNALKGTDTGRITQQHLVYHILGN